MEKFVFVLALAAMLAIALTAGCVCGGCLPAQDDAENVGGGVIGDANAVAGEPTLEELIEKSAGIELNGVEVRETTVTVEYEVGGSDSDEFGAAVALLRAVVDALEEKGEEKTEILLRSGKYRLYVGMEIAKQYAEGTLGKGDWERMRDSA